MRLAAWTQFRPSTSKVAALCYMIMPKIGRDGCIKRVQPVMVDAVILAE